MVFQYGTMEGGGGFGATMMSSLGKRKRSPSTNIERTPMAKHPYLSGNFAPIQQTLPLTPCTYSGRIPEELADGEYVRNGSNPVSNSDLGRDAHWFDGDGMLSGVSFTKNEDSGEINPEFVNQFILTDLYLSAKSNGRLRVPILPSIATLVNPLASFIFVTLRILRTILLVILSHLPGTRQKIKKISVANTNVVYHDGRAMALCESGPPMRVQLPGLETVGWYNGAVAEGEPTIEAEDKEAVLGENSGLIRFMREWTTAHPKVDPQTKEMMMFHSSFAPPYVQYSIVPQSARGDEEAKSPTSRKVLNAGVPGVSSAKMMHDFGVSSAHTVIMDLPLSLDPLNQLKGLPTVAYNANKPSRFGVFPRREPAKTTWFETEACCIFHTANTWDEIGPNGKTTSVNMLACRLTSATLIYAAANIAPPVPPQAQASAAEMEAKRKRMPFFAKYDPETDASLVEVFDEKEPLLRVPTLEEHLLKDPFAQEQCRLYYYNFDLATNAITHQWALSAVPFEFPSVRPDLEMSSARYVYGCSTTTTDFGSALGKATKIDALVKMDAAKLIERGRLNPPRSITGVVDGRIVSQVLISRDPRDPITVFRMPGGWFAQEPRFVPRQRPSHELQLNDTPLDEDDGYLLFYAFNESQLTASGEVPDDALSSRAKSELWIVNAKNMRDVIARVHLPQRVPYGLHGSWFSAEQIAEQRPVETIRSMDEVLKERDDTGLWMAVRETIERWLG